MLVALKIYTNDNLATLKGDFYFSNAWDILNMKVKICLS